MCFLSLIRFSNIPINSHERFLDYLSPQVSSSRFSYRLPLTDLILEHLPKWKSYPFLINLIHPHHSIHYSGRKSKTGSRHRVYQTSTASCNSSESIDRATRKDARFYILKHSSCAIIDTLWWQNLRLTKWPSTLR